MSLHKDITKYIHEFEHNGYITKIVERKRHDGTLFLYFYVLDSKNNECGGMHYYGFDITENDLSDLNICIPKIKSSIDKKIEDRLKWDEEKRQKKISMNWTGQKFERGDYVYFKGNDKFKTYHSYVWTLFGHDGLSFYLIEHPDGYHRSSWMDKPPFENQDGFESVHSSELDEEINYIQINCSNDFFGETNELVLIKKTEL